MSAAAPERLSQPPGVRTSLAWIYGTHLVMAAVTLGSTVIVSRLLSPRELGVFGVGMAICAMVGAISQFGITNYLIREANLPEAKIAAGFTANALVSLVASAVLVLLGTLGGRLFGDPAVCRTLQLLALVPALGVFEFLPGTLLTREMQFDRTSLVQLAKSAINAAATIGLALAGWGYLSFVAGAVLAALFGAVGFSLAGRRHVRCALTLRGLRDPLVFGAQMMSAGGVAVIAPRIAELVIAQQLGLGALGLYSRASGLAMLIWDGAYGLSTRVIYVRMAAELRATGSLRQTFLQSTRLLTAVMWPAMIGLAVLAGPVVHLLYGAQWDGAALPLAVLMLSQFVAIGFAMSWELCVLTGHTGWQARTEIVRAGIGLAVFAVGTLFGLAAASAGRIADAVFGFVVYRPKMREMAGVSAAEMRGAYAGSFVLTGLTVAPALGLMAVWEWSPTVPLTLLGGAIAAGAVLWLAALRGLRHPLYAELAALLPRPRRRAHA